MITPFNRIRIPSRIAEHCYSIKHQNYKVNKPTRFQKHTVLGDDDAPSMSKFFADLSNMMMVHPDRIDCVYFSAPEGAEPHVDQLNPSEFEGRTWLIPVVVPPKFTTLRVGEDTAIIERFRPYMFDHGIEHELTVQDTSGCVMLMVAARLQDTINIPDSWDNNHTPKLVNEIKQFIKLNLGLDKDQLMHKIMVTSKGFLNPSFVETVINTYKKD